MIIKVCGMRNPENMSAVAALGIDLLGLIFYPESPRYVQEYIPSHAGILPDGIPSSMKEVTRGMVPKRVGVFVDEMPQTIVTKVYNYELDYIQLHGHEPRTTCENLRRTLDPDIRKGVKMIKAISIRQPQDVDLYKEYEGAVDMFLFDTKCKTVGGSGEQFDWSVLDRYNGTTPFLLSGGIGPNDAARVKEFRHPQFAGIDLNSRFEVSPAMKDVEKLRKFIREIRDE
ncbi:MAG TPA: N-(5'-phosphoribosyl)anthranilate isomerase [Prevotella sp.]|nr:N-(5'-phosphoribosyl)anthranilate isomerase [Prevotella sp.]